MAAACLPPAPVRAAYVVKPWPTGQPAPPLGLTDLGGRVWTLRQLKGRPVLLNFWATWCEPCRTEMPSLELLAGRHGDGSLVVLSVNYQEPVPAITHFLAASPISLPVLLDHDGAATMAWTTRMFPTTVLIDSAGMPRQSVVGELDWAGAVATDLLAPLWVRRQPGAAAAPGHGR